MTPAFRIILFPKDSSAAIALFYAHADTARSAMSNIRNLLANNNGILVSKDDFGHEVNIPAGNVLYALAIDTAKSQELNDKLPAPPMVGRPSGLHNGMAKPGLVA